MSEFKASGRALWHDSHAAMRTSWRCAGSTGASPCAIASAICALMQSGPCVGRTNIRKACLRPRVAQALHPPLLGCDGVPACLLHLRLRPSARRALPRDCRGHRPGRRGCRRPAWCPVVLLWVACHDTNHQVLVSLGHRLVPHCARVGRGEADLGRLRYGPRHRCGRPSARARLPKGRGLFTFAVRDRLVSANDGTWRVAFGGEGVRVIREPALSTVAFGLGLVRSPCL